MFQIHTEQLRCSDTGQGTKDPEGRRDGGQSGIKMKDCKSRQEKERSLEARGVSGGDRSKASDAGHEWRQIEPSLLESIEKGK